jgi:hypothetical protein
MHFTRTRRVIALAPDRKSYNPMAAAFHATRCDFQVITLARCRRLSRRVTVASDVRNFSMFVKIHIVNGAYAGCGLEPRQSSPRATAKRQAPADLPSTAIPFRYAGYPVRGTALPLSMAVLANSS